MKYGRRIWVSIFWILLGAALTACAAGGLVDTFWSGMGTAFLFVGGLRLIRHVRYRTDGDYREKVDTESRDERNRFLSNKAWAWAGYLFVMIAAVGSIVLKLMGREDLMFMASGSVWLMVLLYWLCFMVLRRKY